MADGQDKPEVGIKRVKRVERKCNQRINKATCRIRTIFGGTSDRKTKLKLHVRQHSTLGPVRCFQSVAVIVNKHSFKIE